MDAVGPSQSTPFSYDPFLASTHADPYDHYRVLRDSHPVYHNVKREFWALSRFEDVQRAARDWETFSNAGGVDLDKSGDVFGPGNFLEMDPPEHNRLRSIVRHGFTPRVIGPMAQGIRARMLQLLEPLLEVGEGDIAEDFAFPLAVSTAASVLGIDSTDEQQLLDWLYAWETRVPGTPEIPASALAAGGLLREYFTGVMADRRRVRRRDLLTAIAEANIRDEAGADQGPGLSMLLFVASVSNPANVITNALFLLDRYRDQRQIVLEDASTLPNAIEEILRYDSPVQNLCRVTTRSVELHGTKIPKGARVLLIFGSANRDERSFDEPDLVNVTRDVKRHLAFGAGIHFCIGAPIARLQAKLALGEILRQAPDYAVAGLGERTTYQDARGFAKLPIALS